MKPVGFLVAGVGGQGALLASNVLAHVGIRAGFDVKKAEVHGMSQRGGSVNSHVRWGTNVLSPIIAQGEADYLVALEKLETLRYLNMVRPGAVIMIGDFKIPPLSVSSGNDHYPDDIEIKQALHHVTENFFFVPTLALAQELGNARTHNVVLLGALSAFVEDVPEEVWTQVIEEQVPHKHHEINRQAYQTGRRFGINLSKEIAGPTFNLGAQGVI